MRTPGVRPLLAGIFVALAVALPLVACGRMPRLWLTSPIPTVGTASAANGEQIYFRGVSERAGRIDYQGGPPAGGMMGSGSLACASCHGPDGRGGVHAMHMSLMDAPDIRWATLSSEMGEGHDEESLPEDEHAQAYDLETFRLAVVEGVHPDGTRLSRDMPRWDLGDEDLADLAEFLRSLP